MVHSRHTYAGEQDECVRAPSSSVRHSVRRSAPVAGALAGALGGAGGAAAAAIGWHYSTILLHPSPHPGLPERVVTAGDGTVELARTRLSAQPGVWGLRGPAGLAVVGPVLDRGRRTVVRELRAGPVPATGPAVLDAGPFDPDPSARGLPFDDVRVPVSNLITEENAGFSAIVNNFNAERIDLAIQSMAFSRVCYDEALAWARERETFGKRLADHQVIRHKLAEMDRQINASKAWLELLSWRLNQGDNPVAEIAEAKVNATLCFEFCAREAAQILGGASYLRGDTVERLYREVRVQAIGGGSEEIMRDLASRQLGL